MKANDFVRKFGLKLAQRDIAALDSGFIKREDFLEHYGFDILDDLKRLVESHDLVEKHGGLLESKVYIWCCNDKPLERAIADVESCQ